MKIDKVYSFFALVTIATTFLWTSSCRHDTILPAGLPEICFEKEVLPIFQNNCGMARCHDGLGENRLSLNNYADISQMVVAYKPNSSSAYIAIISSGGENPMPPSGPLTLENRTIIRLWIEQGARNTACLPVVINPNPGK
jgi:hypothetical protein